METSAADFALPPGASSTLISLVPYTSPTAASSAQFVLTGASPANGSGGPHPPGLDTALTAQRMSRKTAGTLGSSDAEPQQAQQQQSGEEEGKSQQQSRRGRRGRAGQGRQTQRSIRRNKHGKQQQQQVNGTSSQSHSTATAAASEAAIAQAVQPQPAQQQPQSQQQTTPNSRGRRRRLMQQTNNGNGPATDGAALPPPAPVSHRRSTLRSSQRSQAPHTPYNTTAYILAHPPPGVRPASSPDRYGADIVDMPEIDQWKGYGSMEKGVRRLRQQESEQAAEAGKQHLTDASEDKSARAGRSRRRQRDEPSEDRHSVTVSSVRQHDAEEQQQEEMESESMGDTLQPASKQRRGRNSGGGRGRGRGRGRSSRGRSINTSGLREENLSVGDASPALSNMSGSASPAHSVVNGDDIERWTRRQRMQRLKAQKRAQDAAADSGSQVVDGSGATSGDADAVMDDQTQHGWMQRVT